ncbi:MAG: HD-GYP domain-containing protein [Bacteroidales bacterium]
MAAQPWLSDGEVALRAMFSLEFPVLGGRFGDDAFDAVPTGEAWGTADSSRATVAEVARHARRLAGLAPAVGRVLDVATSDLAALRLGGLLHDIGKLAVPFHVLFKRGRLNAEEFEAVRSHAVIGDMLCARVPGLAHVRPIVRHHHERLDGSGYPDGLAGDDIPLLAQIVGIADVYDALVHPRPYKPAYNRDLALGVLRRETALGWRRADLLDALVVATEGAERRLPAKTSGDRRWLGKGATGNPMRGELG